MDEELNEAAGGRSNGAPPSDGEARVEKEDTFQDPDLDDEFDRQIEADDAL